MNGTICYRLENELDVRLQKEFDSNHHYTTYPLREDMLDNYVYLIL